MATANDKASPVQGDVRLWFGKHKGKTVDEVSEIDPSYLMWAHENVTGFRLPKEHYEALRMDEAEDESYQNPDWCICIND